MDNEYGLLDILKRDLGYDMWKTRNIFKIFT